MRLDQADREALQMLATYVLTWSGRIIAAVMLVLVVAMSAGLAYRVFNMAAG